MKHHLASIMSKSQRALSLGALVLLSVHLSVARAADTTYTWDGAASGATWSTSGTNWTPTATNPFNSANGVNSYAEFDTTGLSATISTLFVNQIDFEATTTLLGASKLTLEGTSPSILVNANSSMAADIQSTLGLTINSGNNSTLTLSGGSNTSITGGININGGTVAMGANDALGVAGDLNNLSIASGAALDLVATSDAPVLGALGGLTGAGNVVNSGSQSTILHLEPASGTTSVFSGQIKATGAGASIQVDIEGAGTEEFTGTNTYTGKTTLGNGVLSLGSSGALSTGNISFTGGALQFTSSNTKDYSGQITASTSAISIDTNGQSVTFASNFGTNNTGGLTKLGTGTLTLSGTAPAYTGNTSVNVGTLGVTKALASGTGLSVAGGATFAAGEAAGGTSFGNLTAGSLSLTGSTGSGTESTLAFDLGATTSDSLAVTNGFTLASGQEFNLVLTETAGLPTGSETLLTWGSGGLTSLSQIDLTGSSAGITTADLSISNNSLVFSAAAAPEPSSSALLIVSLLGGLVWSTCRRSGRSTL